MILGVGGQFRGNFVYLFVEFWVGLIKLVDCCDVGCVGCYDGEVGVVIGFGVSVEIGEVFFGNQVVVLGDLFFVFFKFLGFLQFDVYGGEIVKQGVGLGFDVLGEGGKGDVFDGCVCDGFVMVGKVKIVICCVCQFVYFGYFCEIG